MMIFAIMLKTSAHLNLLPRIDNQLGLTLWTRP